MDKMWSQPNIPTPINNNYLLQTPHTERNPAAADDTRRHPTRADESRARGPYSHEVRANKISQRLSTYSTNYSIVHYQKPIS